MLVCAICGSEDIEELEWRKVNTDEFSGLADSNDEEVQWCCICEKHVHFVTKEEVMKEKKEVKKMNNTNNFPLDLNLEENQNPKKDPNFENYLNKSKSIIDCKHLSDNMGYPRGMQGVTLQSDGTYA